MNLSFKPELKDLVVVITGGGGVLGRDFSKALALSGAKVAILDLNLELAQKVADEIAAEGGKSLAVKCNVLERSSIEEAKKVVNDKWGTVDILINGAGGNSPKATTDPEFFDFESYEDKTKKSFFDLDLDGFNFVFGLNFTGTLLPTQIFGVDLLGKKHASILNVSSMNAYTPLTKIPAYSAAKAAISNFTQWLAVHFAKVGIRVNAIAPGFFSTAQNEALLWNSDGTPTARSNKILTNTPMGRFGKPDELLSTLLYLVDPVGASFVTGIVIPVDGGFSAYSGV